MQNEGVAGDGAYIDEIADAHTGALNSAVTPGGMVRVTGHKIKAEGGKPEVGVWFVNKADGARVKVAENLGLNRAAEVMAQAPALAAGTYALEIVTQYSNGTVLLKEPRTIRAEPELTVA
ncbi:MAG: hypothetical protein Pg6C_07490 [Treponemataceae bacterium]|nr:MAG: hypothetical protein Pg6C_07490 [Treponemataceae bacterium]